LKEKVKNEKKLYNFIWGKIGNILYSCYFACEKVKKCEGIKIMWGEIRDYGNGTFLFFFRP